MDDRPAVSVVVASFSGEATLRQCLDSLIFSAPHAELIVAANLGPEALTRLSEHFPSVRFFSSERHTVFQLRSLGLKQARGHLIGLIEDHCTISPEWLNALWAAHQAGYTVLGGPIENGRNQTPYDWALYLCEYSAYMTPLPEGTTRALLAANAAYSREALWSCYPVWQDAFYENEVHEALQAAGHQLYLVEKAAVHSYLLMSLRAAMGHLFAGGCRFGGYRMSQSSSAQRVVWIAAAPAVPLVLLGRIVRRVARRRPARLGRLVLGLPYCLCMLVAWSAGELNGYLSSVWRHGLLGQPGRA
jgi:hypothetical protein